MQGKGMGTGMAALNGREWLIVSCIVYSTASNQVILSLCLARSFSPCGVLGFFAG